MTEDYSHLIYAMANRMTTLQSEMQAYNRRWRKAQRPDLARAKKVARKLRRTLVLATGHTAWIHISYFEGWINQYLDICKRLCVTPPIVKVPKSIRHKFGRTIGGRKKLTWASLAEEAGYMDVVGFYANEKPEGTEG